MAKTATRISEPLGVNLRSIRLRRAMVAGANTGRYRRLFESDDLGSWSATLEREQQDSSLNDALRRGQSPDRLVVTEFKSMLTELPLELNRGRQPSTSAFDHDQWREHSPWQSCELTFWN